MTVTPPNTWGKITGTVKSRPASVVRQSPALSSRSTPGRRIYTLLTDRRPATYAFWLDRRNNNPLTVIVAKDGWQPQVRTIKISAGATTTANWKPGTDTNPC